MYSNGTVWKHIVLQEFFENISVTSNKFIMLFKFPITINNESSAGLYKVWRIAFRSRVMEESSENLLIS